MRETYSSDFIKIIDCEDFAYEILLNNKGEVETFDTNNMMLTLFDVSIIFKRLLENAIKDYSDKNFIYVEEINKYINFLRPNISGEELKEIEVMLYE